MPITQSTMFPLGVVAPDFTLPDVTSQKEMSLADLKGSKGTLIMFICNHCPFVQHVKQQLAQLAFDYIPQGIEFVAINSNDVVKYPDDAPDKMRDFIAELGKPFSYLFDETQQVARLYHAACTPDFYLFDYDLKCIYRGQLDDSRPGNGVPVTGHDLRAAMDNLLAGKPIESRQLPSMGCSIKWK